MPGQSVRSVAGRRITDVTSFRWGGAFQPKTGLRAARSGEQERCAVDGPRSRGACSRHGSTWRAADGEESGGRDRRQGGRRGRTACGRFSAAEALQLKLVNTVVVATPLERRSGAEILAPSLSASNRSYWREPIPGPVPCKHKCVAQQMCLHRAGPAVDCKHLHMECLHD